MTCSSKTKINEDAFGVFFIKAGRWEMWSTHQSRQEADMETAYLTSALGLRAKTFTRASAV